MDAYLALDLGSTAFKASVFSAANQELAHSEYKLKYLKNSLEVEIAVAELENSFSFVVHQAIASAEISFSDLKAIGISSQAQTFTISDYDYQPQLPFVSWLDLRAQDMGRELKKAEVLADFSTHSSFPEIIPELQLVKLAWFIKHQPEIFSKNWNLLSLPSYFIYQLTGKNITDDNIAAMSGLYSLRENSWWGNALKYLEISAKNLPKCIKTGNSAGKIKEKNKYGFLPGTLVYACGNDQTASAFGAKLQKNEILVTLGTAQVVYLCTESMTDKTEKAICGNYPGKLFYKMKAANGGGLIRKAVESSNEFQNYDVFAKLAQKAKPNSHLQFINNKEKDTISWSDNKAESGAKARAVFDYLAESCKDMLEALDYKRASNIYVSGGGVKNRIWLNLIEEKTGKKFQVIKTSPCAGIFLMINPDMYCQ